MGALVVLAAKAGTIEPGNSGECVVLIRNLSAEHDTFDVLVHGPAAGWAAIDPVVVELAPGDEAPVWVRFAVPRDPTITPGPSAFAVTVASRRDPEFIHAERGEIVVGSYAALAATLDPPRGDRRMVTIPLSIANDGNAPVRATVSVRDEYDDPQTVVVPRGGSASVDVEVRRRPGLERVTIDVTDERGHTLSFKAALPEAEQHSLRRDLTRSAAIFGGLLLASVIVVAAVGDDPTANGSLAISPGPGATTTAAAADEAEATAPTTSTGETAAASVGSSGGSRTDPGAAPRDLPTLVFVRWYGPGDRDLVVRSAGALTGGGELRLRSPGTVESSPALSPDGTKVAYVQERGGQWRVCVVSSSGGEAMCLFTVVSMSSVAWRPDGGAVYATRGSELVEAALDPSGAVVGDPVVQPLAVPTGRFALSPDGTRIAFLEGGRIAVRPLAGGDGILLRVPGTPEDPTWSSEGDRIVYTSDTQIHSAPLGDGPVRQLTAPGTVNGDPVVAGSWLVFRSNRSGNGDLYAVRLDTPEEAEAGLSLITRAPERDADPSR